MGDQRGAAHLCSLVGVRGAVPWPTAPRPGSDRSETRQAFLIAETSNSRVTLSLTRTPPVSSAAFQVMP